MLIVGNHYLLADAEYQVVKPILPMDVIAAFVYTPKVSHL